jgi:hypothetical protein
VWGDTINMSRSDDNSSMCRGGSHSRVNTLTYIYSHIHISIHTYLQIH